MGACAEGALLTLLQLPGAASPAWLPALAGVWGLLLPVALLLQAPLPPPPGPPPILAPCRSHRSRPLPLRVIAATGVSG